jgi:hypothetical protein
MFSNGARPAVSTALSCLAAGLLSASVSAQEVSREPFQQYISKSCNSTSCKIDFDTVPGNTRDEVRNVSCYIKSIEADFSIDFVQLRVHRQSGQLVSASTLEPGSVGGKHGNVATFALNHDVFVFASAQEHFQILAESLLRGFSLLRCHISGERVRLQ